MPGKCEHGLTTKECLVCASPKRGDGRQLVKVSSIDVEKLIAACVPGGDLCDPQQVADNIRRYCNAWPSV